MKAVKLTSLVVFLCGTALLSAQQSRPPATPPVDVPSQLNERLMAAAAEAPQVASDYRIGPEDLIDISVFNAPELSRSVRVSASGEISLPGIFAPVKVAGLTPGELEKVLADSWKKTWLKDPQVTVFLKEYKSDPVSIVGAVKNPGLYQIQTRKSLLGVLAMAGGFSEGLHGPGRSIIVSRKYPGGARPVPASQPAPNGGSASSAAQPESIEIPIKDLMQTSDQKWDVPIYPGDVIKVQQAGTVYVVGNVNRQGAFPLTDFDKMWTLQALALAGGPDRSASKKNAMVIRRDDKGNRTEEKIDLGLVQKGKADDVLLGPNDILFVPGSTGKASVLRGVEAAIQAATMLAYRVPL